MNTAVINIKVNPNLKVEAQNIACELGLSVSGLINAFLKQLVRTKAVNFSVSEEPSEYLIQMLKESAEDVKRGRVVSFNNNQEALKYLDKLIKNDKRSGKN